jgi:hypothetical protein
MEEDPSFEIPNLRTMKKPALIEILLGEDEE